MLNNSISSLSCLNVSFNVKNTLFRNCQAQVPVKTLNKVPSWDVKTTMNYQKISDILLFDYLIPEILGASHRASWNHGA